MTAHKLNRDFVERTIELIRQYERLKHHLPKDEQYEKTLFVNCLTGFLVIVREKYINRLPDLTAKIDGLEIPITKIFIKSMRNSLAHNKGGILLDINNDGQVDAINLREIGIIPLDELEPFILKFANELLTVIDD